MYVVNQDQLEGAFEGQDHGVGISFFLVDARPGGGPALHKHAYAEVFIVLEGRATFFAGDEERQIGAGEVVVVPSETPHRFFNSGQGALRQVAIHVSPRFVTEWIERDNG
jgi:mannose-6-phosphate isomerase-like protein (cupin superfamily)